MLFDTLSSPPENTTWFRYFYINLVIMPAISFVWN